MLTTTVDGLWVLQILTGIETLAPELGLRSIRPSVETRHAALAHPIVAELRNAGVIDESDNVDGAVVEWLTVLSRRDVALLISVRTPDNGTGPPGRCWRASPSGGSSSSDPKIWSASVAPAPRPPRARRTP